MSKGKAMAIVKNIETFDCTDEEKAYAIYLVMNMATHMSITKDELITAIKWLWHNCYTLDAELEEKVGEG